MCLLEKNQAVEYGSGALLKANAWTGWMDGCISAEVGLGQFEAALFRRDERQMD